MSKATSKLKRLVTKRNQQKDIVKRAATFCESLEPSRIDQAIRCQLEARLKDIEVAYSEYNKLQSEIELVEKNPDIAQTERLDFETVYYDLMGVIKSILQQNTVPEVPPVIHNDPGINPTGNEGPVTTVSLENSDGSASMPRTDTQNDAIQTINQDPRSANAVTAAPGSHGTGMSTQTLGTGTSYLPRDGRVSTQ